MKYGSVCSGIEAATMAFHPLGWKAAWFSEIEPFPCAVLAHHYPDVPNLGDMTTLPERIRAREVEAPPFLVGGTPCQSFSVAGKRAGMADNRGNLTLSYVETLDAIDDVRLSDGQPEAICLWENVPGCLSMHDNAFGCFLAALVGEDRPLEPGPRPGQGKSSKFWRWDKKRSLHVPKWPDAGVVVGPKRTASWRVLDAQYFGLAQRRERVFVVASARDGFDPAEVFLEREGLRRDTPPRRETGEKTAGDAGNGVEGSHWDGSEVHPSLTQAAYNSGGIGQSNQEIFSQRRAGLVSTHRMLAFGEYADADDNIASTLKSRDGKDSTDLIVQSQHGDLAGTLTASYDASPNGDSGMNVVATFDERNITSKANRTKVEPGQPCNTLHWSPMSVISFSAKDYGNDASKDLSPTLRAGGHNKTHANSGNWMAVAIQERAVCENPDAGPDGSGFKTDGTSYTLEARPVPQAVAIPLDLRNSMRDPEKHDEQNRQGVGVGEDGDAAHTLTKACVHGVAAFAQNQIGELRESDIVNTINTNSNASGRNTALAIIFMLVRRLLPHECERLQGFPDHFTKIPWAKKPPDACPDGPRYKAIGNSKAVPVVHWIGRRIERILNAAS